MAETQKLNILFRYY